MAIRYARDWTDAERAAGRERLSKSKGKRNTIIPASIFLQADRVCGGTNADMASAYDVSTPKGEQRTQRLVAAGLAAAWERTPVTKAHRRTSTAEEAAHGLAWGCRHAPAGQERWTGPPAR